MQTPYRFFIRKSFEIHRSRGTGDRTRAAALTDGGVYLRDSACYRRAVYAAEIFIDIRDRAVGAHVFALRAAVAHRFV